ncbi:GNAT family N-acetyltransferase [Streptomyces sp. NRRL S-1813]|uniref:GNAT family N-acetyltransferase n=1 Tax=Streptomyces sp. NRRL S-1813 TaxID=1463888 RepID=UPI0004CB9CCF|nr:hypothetical protein [Streptomyces sp. NRRL S-1813]
MSGTHESNGPHTTGDSAPRAPVPSTWHPRPETAGDVPAVRRIDLAAFETAGEADLVDALRRDPAAWLPGLSYVAEAPDGTPAAHALLTGCHVGTVPAVTLAPCAALPALSLDGALPPRGTVRYAAAFGIA